MDDRWNNRSGTEGAGVGVSVGGMDGEFGELTAEICKSYLMAVASKMEVVIQEWNENRLDARGLNDLLKVSCNLWICEWVELCLFLLVWMEAKFCLLFYSLILILCIICNMFKMVPNPNTNQL